MWMRIGGGFCRAGEASNVNSCTLSLDLENAVAIRTKFLHSLSSLRLGDERKELIAE